MLLVLHHFDEHIEILLIIIMILLHFMVVIQMEKLKNKSKIINWT